MARWVGIFIAFVLIAIVRALWRKYRPGWTRDLFGLDRRLRRDLDEARRLMTEKKSPGATATEERRSP